MKKNPLKRLWRELSPRARKMVTKRAAMLGITLVEDSLNGQPTYHSGVQFRRGVLTVEGRAEIDSVIHDIGHAIALKNPKTFSRPDSDMNTPEEIAMVVQTCVGYGVPGVRPVERMVEHHYSFDDGRWTDSTSGREWWAKVRAGQGTMRERLAVIKMKKAGVWPAR